MKTGFKNELDLKDGKEKKSTWDFKQPSYDERTSCYINAGTHHGVGYRQPVGTPGGPKKDVPCLPYGRIDTMKVSEVPHKNIEIEFYD